MNLILIPSMAGVMGRQTKIDVDQMTYYLAPRGPTIKLALDGDGVCNPLFQATTSWLRGTLSCRSLIPLCAYGRGAAHGQAAETSQKRTS